MKMNVPADADCPSCGAVMRAVMWFKHGMTLTALQNAPSKWTEWALKIVHKCICCGYSVDIK